MCGTLPRMPTTDAPPRRRRARAAASEPARPTILGHVIDRRIETVAQLGVPADHAWRETARAALADGMLVWLVEHDGRPALLVTNPR